MLPEVAEPKVNALRFGSYSAGWNNYSHELFRKLRNLHNKRSAEIYWLLIRLIKQYDEAAVLRTHTALSHC